MAWRGFRSVLRPILLMAIGCVLFSAASVAFVMHELLNMPWAIGFVLGAIVSPPDAVAALALFRTIRLPRRVVTILQGESLTNDATALVVLGLALRRLDYRHFSLGAAASRFVLIAGGEIAFGVALGWLALRLRYLARAPRSGGLARTGDAVHGVLATACPGWLGRHRLRRDGSLRLLERPRIIPSATRLQGYFIWDLVVWATESLVFLLGGLQAHRVAEAIQTVGWPSALAVGGLVVLTVVLVRFVWVYPATYLPRLLPSLRKADPAPDWRVPFFMGFAGVRGVDGLVAALLVPDVVNGRPLAEYSLILFCTYMVIAVTLVGLGATLPRVVAVLGLARLGREEEQANRRDERDVRLQGVEAVLGFLDRAGAKCGDAAALVVQRSTVSADVHSSIKWMATPTHRLLTRPRSSVASCRSSATRSRAPMTKPPGTDEARRRIERELDIEEERIRQRRAVAHSPE